MPDFGGSCKNPRRRKKVMPGTLLGKTPGVGVGRTGKAKLNPPTGPCRVTNMQEVYGRRYVVRDDGTDDPCREERVWCMIIPHKTGVIYPVGWNGDLGVTTTRTRVASLLEDIGLLALQRGDEYSYRFPVEQFDQVAEIVKPKRRRQVSPELKAKLVERLKLAREKRK